MEATMDNMFGTGQIIAGIDVYGADGNKLGRIVAVQTDYVVVEQEVVASSDYSIPTSPATNCYIPISAIVSVDSETVYLSVATDQVISQGWSAERVDEEDAVSTGFSVTPPDSLADPRSIGAEVLDDGEGFAAWSRDHATTSDDDLDVANERTPSMPLDQDRLSATMPERDTGAGWVETDVFAQQRTAGTPAREDPAPDEWWSPVRPVAASDADPFTEGPIEAPVQHEEMEPLTPFHIATETAAGTDPGRETDTARRAETRIDEDVALAAPGDAYPAIGAVSRDEDVMLDAGASAGRTVQDASGMAGDRSRTQNGRLRSKRGDTLVGSIQQQYGVDFGVRSDMHLSTLLARRGAASLKDLLRGAKSTASGGER